MLIVLLAVFLAIAPVTYADNSDAATLMHLERQWLRAIQIRDTVFLDKLLAEDFVDISTHGEIRHKADVLRGRVGPVSTTQSLSDMQVREYGTSAVVTGLNIVSDKSGDWTVHVRFTDVFVNRDGKWRAVSAEETLVRH